MDQPAGLLDRMAVMLNGYNAWKGYMGAQRQADWTKANPDGWKIAARILRQRGVFGGN